MVAAVYSEQLIILISGLTCCHKEDESKVTILSFNVC